MATPSKSSDPSAAAMSAIEEALNLVDFDKETGKEAAKQSSVPVVDKGAAHAEKAQSASGDAARACATNANVTTNASPRLLKLRPCVPPPTTTAHPWDKFCKLSRSVRAQLHMFSPPL